MEIQAYFEDWARRPGETARLAISTAHSPVHATLVRLLSGPAEGDSPEGRTEALPQVLDTQVPGRIQTTAVGSYASLKLPAPLQGGVVSLHAWIWPTVPQREAPQTVWSLGDLALVIASGGLQLRAGDAVLLSLSDALVARQWYSVLVTLGDGEVLIDLHRLGGRITGHRLARASSAVEAAGNTLLLAASGLAASGSPLAPYNGKIDSPTLYSDRLASSEISTLHAGRSIERTPLAAWDLGRNFTAETIASVIAGAPPGRLHNGVERAVTGRNWDGRSDSFIEVPEQYCALQFHDDDMVDAGWHYDIEFTLPRSLPSGVYAVRLRAGAEVNHFPLFVAPDAAAKAPVLFLVPTNSYLAYANDHLAALDFSQVITHRIDVPEDERYLFSHPEPGRSCYDTHSDGTPVRYSSSRRPVFNVRPGFKSWLTSSHRHFSVDMYTLEWLEHVGIPYHVATDEDLEREGAALLDRHRVVVTGSHPEYWTRCCLDALEAYAQGGGRVMYLGGNGFYWVTSRFAKKPWVIEVRRDNTGTRCWDAPVGERTHVATAEAGGLWRGRGRGPNKTVGVGFASQGWSQGCGYRRLDASYDSPAAKFFEGVNDTIIGDYGHVLGGAVGDEVDRYDIALGSPENAYVLATSTGLGNEYQLVIEDQTMTLPGQGGAEQPKIRADMVVIPIDGGGCIFSAGSITYAGSLAWNGCENGLSRVTANVLRSFASAEPVF